MWGGLQRERLQCAKVKKPKIQKNNKARGNDAKSKNRLNKMV
ncbi:hypothetical protein DSBG_3911 [Desulfosporosinus sp. BG]|nr:hypothetical protein DSBG_3911 [Desulfosporosinus sp. BG]